MWFRNLQLYRIGKSVNLDPDILETRLAAEAFRPCGRMDSTTLGWTTPLGRHGQQLIHAANGYFMLCARREEKIIPATVVRQLLEEKVADVEAAEDREVYRREKLRLKEEIMVDLLPRALSRVSNQFAYIDSRNRLLIVDSASASKAEMLIGLLRDTLGRFPAIPVEVNNSLPGLMTRWLNGEPMPSGLSLGSECELRHPDPEGGIVSCKHQDLGAGEVRNHIKAGKYAVRVALNWKDRLNCVLHEDLSLHRLKFDDIVHEQEDASGHDDPATMFDLDFSLMTLELAAFLPALIEILGGEADGEEAPVAEPGSAAMAELA